MKSKYFLIITLSIYLSSCQLVYRELLGMNRLKQTSEKRHLKFAAKYNIPLNNAFQIDGEKYYKEVNLHKEANSKLYNNLLQPIQIRVYDKSNNIDFIMFSCIVPPKGLNINWNADVFNTFPPIKQELHDTILGDYTISLEKEISYLKISETEKERLLNLVNESELNLVLYWSIMGGRQSENMIFEIESFKKRFPENKINTIYINIDNLYLEIEE